VIAESQRRCPLALGKVAVEPHLSAQGDACAELFGLAPLGVADRLRERVISVGSLSKTVWAGPRIGWVRAPGPVIARLGRLLAVHDLGGNIPGQLAAAGLLPRLGPLSQRRAAELKARHDHLRAELARHLPDWHAPPVQDGQTLWVRLPHGDATSFAQAALRDRVAVLPGNGLDASGRSGEYLRLHFLASPGDLTEATRRSPGPGALTTRKPASAHQPR